MPDRSRKRPRDINQLAAQLVNEGTDPDSVPDPGAGKDPAAVALGRKGGRIGGRIRAANMTPEARSESARKAAEARWAASRRSREGI